MSEKKNKQATSSTEAPAGTAKAWSKPKKSVELEAKAIGDLLLLIKAGGDVSVRVQGEAGAAFCSELKAALLSIDKASKDVRIRLSLRSVFNLTAIEAGTFEGVNCLTSISLGKEIKAIGEGAFLDCCIEEIRLPEELQEVGEGAFDLFDIKRVWWPGSKDSWAAFCASEHVKGRNEPLLCAGEVCCADGVFEATEEIEIDSAEAGQFRNRVDLRRVTVKRGVTQIGSGCFKGCANLVEAKLCIDIQQIGDEAFYHCTRLKKARLPARVKRVGKSAFADCRALEAVAVPQTLKAIEEKVFAGCFSLKELETGMCLETIGEGAFAGCLSLESIGFHYSLRTIESGAFAGCESLKTLRVCSPLYHIGQGAFSGCKSLEVINYKGEGYSYSLLKVNSEGGNEDFFHAKVIFPPSGPNLVESSAGGRKEVEFGEVKNPSCEHVTSIVIEEGIEVINATYCNYWELKTMSLPASLKEVGWCVEDAYKLEVVYYGGTKQDWFKLCTSKKFSRNNVRLLSTKTVCSDGVFEPWQEAEAPIKKGQECVKTNEFLKRIDLKKITIAEGTRVICKWAFRACARVEEIDIPSSVEVIEASAFLDCAHLKTLKLSEGLLEIGTEAFRGCASLEELVLPSTVKRVERCAFRDCSSLRRVFIPAGIEYLCGNAFCWWTLNITEIHFGGTKEQWQALAVTGEFKKNGFPKKETKVIFEG